MSRFLLHLFLLSLYVSCSLAFRPEMSFFEVQGRKRPILCQFFSAQRQDISHPSLLFTHGAGGDLSDPSTHDFSYGFGATLPVVSFQIAGDVDVRVRAFNSVYEHVRGANALGGRSIGSRAAVMTAQQARPQIQALVLVSYPLVSEKAGEVRDGILRELQGELDVLFVIGSNDTMCDLHFLNQVRQRMRPRTWLIEVVGANHHMLLDHEDKGGQAVRQLSGTLAAQWLQYRDPAKRYSAVRWDESVGSARTDGWV